MLPYAPDAWTPDLEDDPESQLEADRCVVRGQEFFLRGVIRLPVLDGDDDLDLGVWVAVGEDDFERAGDAWDVPPFFGWLTTELSGYARSTVHLKTRVHTRPPGVPALVVLEPTDHPLAIEQREGITEARATVLSGR